MGEFKKYLMDIENHESKLRMEEILKWISEKYPNLVPKIAWNQPLFTDHGTFIIGFSISKNHIAVAPEKITLNRFTDDIRKSGYEFGKQIIKIKWNDPVDYSLLSRIIEFNISEKKNCKSFWR